MFINSLRRNADNFLRHCIFRRYRLRFSTSQTADPYYILGVDKSSDFDEVKRVFYSLANQYHPDKNTSPDAARHFILIKEAFEAIKLQKGLSVIQNLEKTMGTSYASKSRRPDAQNFETDWSQPAQSRKQRDYRMEKQKVPEGEQYNKFRTSFTTIDDINDVKIRVQQGQMKDAAERFGLEKLRAKNKILSDGGISFIFIIVMGLGIFFLLVNNIHGNAEKQKTRALLLALLQMQSRNQIKGNDEISAAEIKLLEQDPQYHRYKAKKQVQLKKGSGSSAGLNKQDKVISSDQLSFVL